MEPRIIADYDCVTGENPLWHPIEKKLYWNDIPTGRMFRYDPKSEESEQFYGGDIVGGFTFQENGELLLFMERGAIRLLRDEKLLSVCDELKGATQTRFNDVIADPIGGVFCGTMPSNDENGKLYYLKTDGTISVLLDGIKISNGLGFSPDRKKLYYTESEARKIYIFDYDRNDGKISNGEVFVEVAEDEGVPDGLTVDAEGYIWSARWDGSCIVRLAPDGSEERRIEFPAKKVTCMTFGGDNLTDIYVTTAGGGNKKEEGTGAGALFHLELGIKGLPEFPSKLEISPELEFSEPIETVKTEGE